MANNKKKNHFYVLVFTETGPTYVTKVNNVRKEAHYDKDEKPFEFEDEAWAQDVAIGLNLNFNPCVMVKSKWEIDNQPYFYSKGHFEWKKED